MMEPIAIVGMACRFPGAASLAEFWELLAGGGHGIAEVPADRWNAEALYDADPKAPGKVNTRHGGFVRDVDMFDAAFFGVSPREAVQMDPQQRILAELAYEAIENAGMAPASLAGSDTAVYVGLMSNDYLHHQLADDLARVDVHTGAGAGYSMTANRLSYLFDFHGPSVAVDSACSSSLTGAFLACQALWTEQSRVALAAGVNLMLNPAFNVFYTKSGLSAVDGKCKTFAAAADGIGRGEGAGVVVLKKLTDAQADGDRIYAVIRGGAINHDGRSNGLSAPNRWAQEQLLRAAFRHAGVRAGELQYIELHGTGTLIGDPIEANALTAVMSEDGAARAAPCLVGSVKTNIGHLEGAAGVAGLIKLALSIAHRRIPPSLWFDAPNPHLPVERSPLEINAVLTPWPAHADRCLAGVSSFGLGGANAHLVLESAPAPATRTDSPNEPLWLLLSARSADALQASVGGYVAFLEAQPDENLPAICEATWRRKDVHEHRISVLARDRASLAEGLRSVGGEPPSARAWTGRYRSVPRRRIVVAAAQHDDIDAGLVADWLRWAPAARAAWTTIQQALRDVGGDALPPAEALAGRGLVRASDADYAYLHFAAQYAQLVQLADMLPVIDAVVADGLGQLAAYCAAGALAPAVACDVLTRSRYADPQIVAGTFRFVCETSSGSNAAFAQLKWISNRQCLHEQAIAARRRLDAHGVWLPLLHEEVALAREDAGWIGTESGDAPYYWRVVAQLAAEHALAWPRLFDRRHRFVPLPAYPWQRQRYWLPAPARAAAPIIVDPARARATGTLTRADLAASPPAARRDVLVRYLRDGVAAALHLSAPDLDIQQPLNTLGMDSLTAVEVKNRVERDLQISLPVVKFLDGYAIGDFADFILEATAQPSPADQTPPPASGTPVDAIDPAIRRRVEAMSASQLDDMLRQLMPQGTSP